MDKLNVRIEAARLAVESGANKETFTEMARVIEKYIIGTSELLEYENPNAAMEKAMDFLKVNHHEKKKLPIWKKRMKNRYNDNSSNWIWIYFLALMFDKTWK